jgi:hypothetical protein
MKMKKSLGHVHELPATFVALGGKAYIHFFKNVFVALLHDITCAWINPLYVLVHVKAGKK